MSAAIESMVWNSENGIPWHKEGQRHDGLLTTNQALHQSGLDWTVSRQPIVTESGIEIPDKFAIVRDMDEKVFTVMGKNYRPLQNTKAFEWFDEVLGEGEAVIETAGSLKGGRMVWVLAQFPDYIRIDGTDDLIAKYLLLANSHDGTTPVVAQVTPVRVVCANTLALSLSRKNSPKVKIRHTENMSFRLGEAQRVLGITNMIYEQVDDIFNQMAKKQLKSNDMDVYFNKVLGGKEDYKELSTRSQNIVDEAKGLLETGAGMTNSSILKRGTVWHGLQAITEYSDHHRNLKDGTDELHANWFGSGAKLKEKAFKEAVAFLN